MTQDGSPKDDARPSAPNPPQTAAVAPSPPVAWLPLTPRGVAAFATAGVRRLLLVQLVVASLAAATLVWFLHVAWFPVVGDAIRQLPDEGVIRGGKLESPAAPIEPSLDRGFLSLTVEPGSRTEPNPYSDLQVKFRLEGYQICGALGCAFVAYPRNWIIEFNRPALEPWWGAWEPALLAGAAVFPLFALPLIWAVLATLYFIPARLAALYTQRKLTLAGSWRLAGAALMPGALLLTVALLLYGCRVLDGPSLVIMTGLHFVAGWIYVVVSPLFLPKSPYVARRPSNPFGPSAQAER